MSGAHHLAVLAEQGMTVLLVEQFASLALRYGSKAYVLSQGVISDQGTCGDFLEDPDRLHAAYFSAGSQQLTHNSKD